MNLCELHVAAEVDFEAEFGEGGGLDAGGAVGLFLIRGVDDLNVIGLVAGHHLVAVHAIEDGVHDRPLNGGFVPASFGFLLRERDDFRGPDVNVELAPLDEDAAPDDVAGFADATE